jgi:2-desacetyl-2-hydroxyethyl bacteriochlorophyllide A dehydrogenase
MSVRAPAIVFAEPGRVEVRSVDVPEVHPNEVGVRTAYSGVSQGTERWLLTGRYNRAGEDVAANYPCFPGYQAAGTVERTGANVTDIEPGDPVMLQGTRLTDARNPGPGLASHVGYLVALRSQVTRLRPQVDLAEAALFRMAAVARHGARLTRIRNHELVVVIGQGLIGQMSAQAARRRGARVIAADLIRSRVEASRKYSADVAVDVLEQSVEDVVRTEAPGGADVVVDTTGDSRMFETCLALVRPEGRICLQGYYPDPIAIDFHPTHLKRPTVTFPCGWDGERDGELAEDLAARRVVIAPLITHRVPYHDASSAYQLVVEHPERGLGMVFSWEEATIEASGA